METDEDPFSRIRRRKKDNRGDAFSARRERSSNLSRLSCAVGSLLVMSCRRPMADCVCVCVCVNGDWQANFYLLPAAVLDGGMPIAAAARLV